MRGDRDPYQALGLGADASTADISRAYRRLARTLHPDSQPGDVGAAEQFRAVLDAYELLSDPARRRDWDRRHPPQASSPQRPQGRSALAHEPTRQQIWPLSPGAANPPPGSPPALWAGPVRVEPAPGAGSTARQARYEWGYSDLAWILQRLLADSQDLEW